MLDVNLHNPLIDGHTNVKVIDGVASTKALQEPAVGQSMGPRQIRKNIFVISIAFVFLFTAFNCMANLQTSLNKEDGVGAWSLSTIYVSLIVSCMFLPNFIISRLGCKWTIPISMVGYILYMCANFYAVKGTMIPASIILGVGAAPLWISKCIYLTQLGVWYAKLTKQDQDGIINMFFGFFFSFFQTSQIWGNLISSLVFAPDKSNTTTDTKYCGARFCPEVTKTNGSDNFSQTTDKVYTVCGIYLASAVIAVIIVSIFLDRIVLDKETSEEDRKLSPKLLISTFRHLFSSPLQALLVPLTVYSGLEQAFFWGDFTQAYISCTLGIWNLGYVMICYGVADALCSILFGRLVVYIGHIPFFIFVFINHGALQIAFLLWRPQENQQVIFYVCAALWGMGDAVMQTQLNALYGNLFSDKAEAGFANYRLWESLGFAVTYAYNDYLCTDTKLYVCLGVLGTSVICYFIVELMSWRAKKTSLDITKQ
ncbi:protein unc-93 homolog A-like [Physella acuta]|uniref:protein unc-93 homolog A-like n=1 Tax=Physella acuta TaxID=109671 RepID=UPI0027DD9D85|nr:protein unc-93 homolog A-like [Physella acuta]